MQEPFVVAAAHLFRPINPHYARMNVWRLRGIYCVNDGARLGGIREILRPAISQSAIMSGAVIYLKVNDDSTKGCCL